MSVPRFAAEASLYKTSEHYVLAQTWSRKAESQAVVPSWLRCLCRWSICAYDLGPPIGEIILPCPPLNCFCFDPEHPGRSTRRHTQARAPGFLHGAGAG
jgi:hypothetical protein